MCGWGELWCLNSDIRLSMTLGAVLLCFCNRMMHNFVQTCTITLPGRLARLTADITGLKSDTLVDFLGLGQISVSSTNTHWVIISAFPHAIHTTNTSISKNSQSRHRFYVMFLAPNFKFEMDGVPGVHGSCSRHRRVFLFLVISSLGGSRMLSGTMVPVPQENSLCRLAHVMWNVTDFMTSCWDQT